MLCVRFPVINMIKIHYKKINNLPLMNIRQYLSENEFNKNGGIKLAIDYRKKKLKLNSFVWMSMKL